MSRCGRCRGRGVVKPTIGFGDKPCPDCKGAGVKARKATLGRDTFTIPLRPGSMCRFCGDRAATENHHVAPQQRVKPLIPRDLWEECLTDLRDGIPACRTCHDQAESDPTLVTRDLLHPRFFQWVREWRLDAAVPRHLTCGAAAQTSPDLTGTPNGRGTVLSRARSPREEVQ